MTTTTTTTTTSKKVRKPKWHPTLPPPPSPKILNLPRRTRRKQPKNPDRKQPPAATKTHSNHHNYSPLEFHKRHYYFYDDSIINKGKLENLFGQEREFSRSDTMPVVLLNSSSFSRRERVGDDDGIVVEELREDGGGESGGGGGGFEVEKWKFQAEILRAECNFLRMEREFALKKLERNRKQMERALKSAVQTLLNGREKIFEGKNVTSVLKEEIEDLTENLKKLQKKSGTKVIDHRNCNNFDKEACRLQLQLEKLGGLSDEKCLKEMQEVAESSLSTNLSHEKDKESSIPSQKIENKSAEVELLRRKMEGLSKGMLDRMEEAYYGSLLSTAANSSVASSASTSNRMECPDFSGLLSRHQEGTPPVENKCSGRCKAIVRRIVEQVRSETEQWSQMQEMLGQVRAEMEEMQASRDFWEDQALKSEHEIQVLQSSVQEWKEKAFNFEAMANELETEISELKARVGSSRGELGKEQHREVVSHQHVPLVVPLGKYLEKENCITNSNLKISHQNDDQRHQAETDRKILNDTQDSEVTKTTRDLPPLSLGKQLAKEKCLFLHRLKENRHHNLEEGRKQEFSADGRRKAHASMNGLVALKRLPFRDIGNSSPLTKQNTKAVFPLHSPQPCKTGESI